MKDQLGTVARRAVRSRPAVAARRWLGIRGAARSNHELSGVPVSATVVVYFADPMSKIYQLQQWLPILELLHERHPVLLVFRNVGALRGMKSGTRLPMIFVRRFADLANLYDENKYRLAIYVNNGVSNFQSLTDWRMVHVHVNHGESDKLSMVSNQAKAYDRVFVAGPAALDRHRAMLIDFDESKLLMVGRPQLDVEFAEAIAGSPSLTVMYAPTWPGENDANNYTSLDVYGVVLVETLLRRPGVRIVYKPHPRVPTSKVREVREAHESIMERIELANERDGGRHVAAIEGNVLAMFEAVDALVTDVSSVGLDFLYLHPEKPLILTDRWDDSREMRDSAPVSAACHVVDRSALPHLNDSLLTWIESDSMAGQRREMREYYFGGMSRGESMGRFLDAIDTLIDERNRKLSARPDHPSSSEGSEGDDEQTWRPISSLTSPTTPGTPS